MKRILLIVLVLLMASTAVFANGDQEGTSGSKNGITVVFVPKLSGNAFFESANEGAQAYAQKMGFTVKYDGNPEASVANQVTIIDNAINSGADAICVSSVDSTGLDDIMGEAKSAGLKVVTWDSDVSGFARSLMVSQGTPDILGKMLVDMLADSLKERGKDPSTEAIKYVWHYSQPTVADQNSWQVAGEEYIRNNYPNWVNVNPSNYYSGQDAEKAITIGEAILTAHPDIDGIICNDSTALPGQAQAAQNLGINKDDVSITGFASPNSMKMYAKAGVLARWGLWDCQVQGALGCYLAYYLASGNEVKVGDKIDVPEIGTVEVLPNSVLDPNAYTADDSGVVLIPERTVFTVDNMDNYNF
ncbi:MAG: substrate-binding domain-containing protein [Spirochaetales bacterium]|nr:substrate-binding domain-containing protein [Spirochaetales bacterium]